MKWMVKFCAGLAGIGFALLFAADSAQANPADAAIASQSAVVDGVKLHYLKAGHGPAVILLHGYTQTSRMWRPIMPLLAEKFTVIAPDLPGIGDSEIPKNGLDMKSAAISIHGLAKSLGIEKARVVGHDIGLMVAYAYAAQFPAETEKLAVMDAFLPGVAGWEDVYNNPGIWHFRFNGPTPEALVRGRERTYFDYFWNDFAADKNHSLPEADRIAYTAAYARPGRMHAGWEYFVSFQQAAEDFAEFEDEADHAMLANFGGSPVDSASRADEARGDECDDGRAQRLRALGVGRKAQGDDRSACKVPVNSVVGCGCVKDASGPRKG